MEIYRYVNLMILAKFRQTYSLQIDKSKKNHNVNFKNLIPKNVSYYVQNVEKNVQNNFHDEEKKIFDGKFFWPKFIHL